MYRISDVAPVVTEDDVGRLPHLSDLPHKFVRRRWSSGK